MYGYNVTHQTVYKLQKTMYQYNVNHQNVYKLQKTMYHYNVTLQNVSSYKKQCINIMWSRSQFRWRLFQ